MQRVFLHVGAQKTGTSYLQATLWQNRDRLAEAGVHLPGERRLDHFHACMDLQEVEQEPDHPVRRWSGMWAHLVSEAIASRRPAWLITDETLAATEPEQTDRVRCELADREVHLVFTLRELAGLLVAAWQQHVRERGADHFDDWLQDVSADRDHRFWRLHDPASVFERWGIPPERTHLVTVPPARVPPVELWLRFARVLSVDAHGWPDADRANPSLGDVEVEVMRRIQERMGPGAQGPRQRRLTKDVVGRRVLTRSSRGGPIRIPARHRPWVVEQHQSQIDYLRRSGVDIVGSLDDLALQTGRFGDAVAEPGSDPDPDPDPDPDQMLDAALDVIERLVRRSARVEGDLERELRRLRDGGT